MITFKSEFEKSVFDKLIEIGYKADANVGVFGYKLDLAVYDKDSGKYVLGIECDNSAYKSSSQARERDIHRLKYLRI